MQASRRKPRQSQKKMAEIASVVSAVWPIMLAAVLVIISLAKLDGRVGTLEEKVKVLFELFNKDK